MFAQMIADAQFERCTSELSACALDVNAISIYAASKQYFYNKPLQNKFTKCFIINKSDLK